MAKDGEWKMYVLLYILRNVKNEREKPSLLFETSGFVLSIVKK